MPRRGQSYTKLYAKLNGNVSQAKSFSTTTNDNYTRYLQFFAPDSAVGRTYYRINLWNWFSSGEVTTELTDGSVVELPATTAYSLRDGNQVYFNSEGTSVSDVTFSLDEAGYKPLTKGKEYAGVYMHIKQRLVISKVSSGTSAILIEDDNISAGWLKVISNNLRVTINTNTADQFEADVTATVDSAGTHYIIDPQTVYVPKVSTKQTLPWFLKSNGVIICQTNFNKL